MKRTQNIITRTLADGTNVYDVRISVNGKERWKYGYATLDDACLARDDIKLQIRKGTYEQAKDESLRLIKDVIALRLQSTVRRKAIRDTERMADWWTNHYKTYTLKDVTLESLEAARQRLLTSGQKGARSVATVNRYMVFMSSVLRYAVKRGWLPFNPADQIKNYREPDAPEYEVTEEQEPRLYEQLGYPHSLWARLAILTGMRASEQFKMQPSWVNLDDQLVRLPETKAGGAQFVFLSNEACAILRTILDSHTSQYVFPNEYGDRPIDYKNFYNTVYKRAMKRLGWTGYTWHTLRHTFCSRLARKAKTFADLLAGGRWKSPSVALRYWHTFHAQVREALEEASTIGGQGEGWAKYAWTEPHKSAYNIENQALVVAKGVELLNRRRVTPTAGSNPALSATIS